MVTLQEMRRLAREDCSQPDILLIAQFCRTLQGLDDYLREYWVYVKDPEWAEYVRGPTFQIEIGKTKGYFEGDCDDAATFGGSISVAMGIACCFTAYRLRGKSEFSHVNLRCMVNGGFFDIDPTVPSEKLPVQSEEQLVLWL